MSQLNDKVVLITGASSGIGEGTARVLAAAGARLVLGARRTDRLQALAEDLTAQGAQVRFRTLDVTSLVEMQAFVAFAESAFGRVDVLVNNAGVMPLSPLAALKVDEWNWMIDVNIRGVLHGIAAVLPKMEAQGAGQIINVSSIGGFVAQPTAAVYAATKFAVRAISEGLRKEHDKIRCTCVYPGVVESELADTISDATARDRMITYRKTAIQPDAIGRAILFAIEQPGDVDVNEIVVRPSATVV
ncbi:SDR family oxidoreductase [Acidisoma cladoniae]|jgi:NADP-dependent 3-hydroxy acid dehydrogenase YdfG|uniref:SDR family oxidoreductase n=1 Tax=Acidisoma cladoniae TaxID=3040935 RepID=UPI0025518BC5|nr:SDR family oxidoreductase [Acidisoma sp. PAMC 29798]